MDLDYNLKNLPDKPGVYIMKDQSGEIIYVGKAKSLKNRVRQYFQASKNKGLKVESMVRNIDDFEYIIVDNEVEALILESNLIKKHRPKYNILLRDDKQYPYIKISLNEDFPRVLKTRTILKDKAKYFGPYPSGMAVNHVIDTIHELYPIRNCKLNLSKNIGKYKACLNYHIGRCKAPCIGNINEDEYMKYIGEIIEILNGKGKTLVNILEEEMIKASRNLEFERASIYRDKLASLEIFTQEQKIVSTRDINRDIIGLARELEEVCIQVFNIREGKILGREHYILDDKYKDSQEEIVTSFIKQYYMGASGIPREILISYDLEEKTLLEEFLTGRKGSKVSIVNPKKGENLKLIEMVQKNAREMLDKYGDKFLKKHRENLNALDDLGEKLGIENQIRRIEAYDISNTSGVQSVGSMVVFENGEPKKSDYRRFKIRSVRGPDDYKSMEEVLERRFLRAKDKGFSYLPDLIMIDGGKGQVNIVRRLLLDMGIEIPICGLVKDDFHKTRGIIYENREYLFTKTSNIFRMIYKIQEEAHRFAINYHRNLRSKDLFRSQLDDIEGVGEKRKRALIDYFKGIDGIRSASVEDLLKVDSINERVANNIYEYFKEKRRD